MADATGGSSAGAGAGAGHGSLGRDIVHQQFQAFLASSMDRIAPRAAANIYPPPQSTHHQLQNPIGALIPPAPVGMSTAAPRPMYPTQIVAQLQPQQLAPPAPPQFRVVQSQQQPTPLPGHYQHQGYYSANGNTGSSTSPSLDYAGGWGVYGNALMPAFSHPRPFVPSSINVSNGNITVVNSNGGFHQNYSSPNSTNIWTSNYVPMNRPCYYGANYVPPAATNEPAPQAPAFYNNNNNLQQESTDLGFAASFGSAAPLVPASPSEVMMPQRTTNSTMAQIFQEEVDNLDGAGTLGASGSVHIEGSLDSVEFVPAPELEAQQDQLGQAVGDINATDDTMLNCKDYRTVLRKDLTNSDCGNTGRIVLPKKVVEANLPYLVHKEGMILEMDDFELPDVWKFKYRYWPNIKSRMYVLEYTGEFVKTHNLKARDVFIMYQHKRTGRYVARAVKAGQMRSNMTAVECQCLEEGNSGEDCGFVVNPPTRRTVVLEKEHRLN